MEDNRTKFYSLTLVTLLTVSAFFLADTVDAMVGRSLNAAPRYTLPLERTPAAVAPRHELSDYSSVLDRGLFGDGTPPAQKAAATAAAAAAYKLVGTVEGDVFAGAVLEDDSGQAFYRRGQTMPDGSMIVKVERTKVTIKTAGGSTYDIEVADDTKIVPVKKQGGPVSGMPAGNTGVEKISNSTWVVDQKEVLASTDNMGKILTQARALPFQEQGKVVGFQISEIVPGSIYQKIGLQNGDVIQRVNSQAVDDPAKFFQLYQGLRTERSITIDLLRNGQPQTLNYEIR